MTVLDTLKKYVVFVMFVGLLILGGMFAWDRRQASRSDVATAAWVARVEQRDSLIFDLVQQRNDALLARTQNVPVYIQGRDRIIQAAASSPTAASAVADAFELADRQRAIDAAVIHTDSVLIEQQRQQIEELKNKPEPHVKRAVWKVGLGYAVISADKIVQSAPAVRGGVDYRLVGPVSLSADAQLTMPGAGRSNPTLQGTALVNIKF